MGLFQNITAKLGDGNQTPRAPSFLKNAEGASLIVEVWPSPTGQVVATPLDASSILGGVLPYETKIKNQVNTAYATTTSGLGSGMVITTNIAENKFVSAVISTQGSLYAPGDVAQITLDTAVGGISGSLQGLTENSENITGTLTVQGVRSFGASGGSGSTFGCVFSVAEIDGVKTIQNFAIADEGSGYKAGDVLYFSEWSQSFYWTLTEEDIQIITSSQVRFELQESNFTDADLNVTTVLQPGELTNMRVSKFVIVEASNRTVLCMVNKTI